MTEIRMGIAAVLAAGLFLLAVMQGGRAYRTASDLELRPVNAGATVRSENSGRPAAASKESQRGVPAARPSSGKDGSAASNPAARTPAPAPTPVRRERVAPPSAQPQIEVERTVYYGSTDDYKDEPDDDPDEKERDEDDGDDGK